MFPVRQFVSVAALLAFSAFAAAFPYHGTVTFSGLPVPGATITLHQGNSTLTTLSDANGSFQFDDLTDGDWSLDIAMQCFAPFHADVHIALDLPAAVLELKLLDPAQIQANALLAASPSPVPATGSNPIPLPGRSAQPAPANAQTNPQEIPKAPEANEQGADGFLVQGSVNNAATSQYATNPAFGNTRSGSKALYTGGFAAFESNSALNAAPYALSGVAASRSSWNDFTGALSLQGPLKISRLLPHGPNFFVSYQWTRNSDSSTLPGLVPTAAERAGDLAALVNALGQPVTVYQPGTNQPYAHNQIPVSSQAAALLKLYPMPNIASLTNYNYQAVVLDNTHQDALQSRFDKNLGRKDNLNGRFAFQSTRSANTNLFAFTDQIGTLGLNASVQWAHRLSPRVYIYINYAFSRLRTELTPNFAFRQNISDTAGINGNDQQPIEWGPPTLSFSDGTIGLNDANSSFNRNRTDALSISFLIYHRKHNLSAGTEFRRQEYNDRFQQNPRGTFTFTGAATAGNTASGSALADFLIGIPDASTIAYGNTNKYFRETVASAYVNDDWRVLPILTINAGLRWDLSAPITELNGNLVNLDVANGFAAVAPVLASNPVGSLTGAHYPTSLIRPDWHILEPRIGITWRPIAASTIVIKGGYGLYPDTSVYQNVVLNMAQQAPLSTSLSVQNSSSCPLTLAAGFASCTAVTSDTFGIDPNFRIGYAQTWQLSVQRDLPLALQMTATYSGIKGTHGPQETLPNSYPLGTSNPCPQCPSGFVYETSGGSSIREAGQLQLRRRLRGGFSSSLTYTFAKSLDDDAYLGGLGHVVAGGSGATQSAALTTPSASVAQNWLNPGAERSLSGFDQRQLLNLQTQYTSGQGLVGGTLLGGWRGRALKEWTVTGNLTWGTGQPESPIYPATVPGTGFSGILRPDLTGASLYTSGSATHLNAAAFSAPLGGWGSARRNSIEGPGQLTFNMQMARTFRPHGKWYLDVAILGTNILNHPAFASWNNVVTSTQFGLPSSAGAMRSLQTTFHLRWQ